MIRSITGPDITGNNNSFDYEGYAKARQKSKNVLRKIEVQHRLAKELSFAIALTQLWPEVNDGVKIAACKGCDFDVINLINEKIESY